jgi:hypothetical protein
MQRELTAAIASLEKLDATLLKPACRSSRRGPKPCPRPLIDLAERNALGLCSEQEMVGIIKLDVKTSETMTLHIVVNGKNIEYEDFLI